MEKKGIFLTNRHISLLLSVFILSSFFVFISGYFFGKKKSVEKFYSKVDQESLADHVYYSVCSNYGNCDVEQEQEQESGEESSGLSESEKCVQDSLPGKSCLENQEKNIKDCTSEVKKEDLLAGKNNAESESLEQDEKFDVKKTENINTQEQQEGQDDQYKEQYYAELVGFGSKVLATAFCNKLKKRGIKVILKSRRSRTSRGRNVEWYQAVTEKFDNKSDLIAFVDIIKSRENLKGVKIVQC